MTAQMKSIDQTVVLALLKARAEYPEQYVDKPLFIWQAEVLDGIQQRLVMEACRDRTTRKSTSEASPCVMKTLS